MQLGSYGFATGQLLLLLLLLLLAPACPAATSKAGKGSKAGKPKQQAKDAQTPPILIDAHFKGNITEMLTASLADAISHMAWALGLRAGDRDGSPLFGRGYELAAEGWRWNCEAYEPASHCAIRKFQALTAFCEVKAAALEYRIGIQRLLKQLMKRNNFIEGLGVKRDILPGGNGIEAWMSEVIPGSGKYDVIIPLHAAAMLAVVQCSSSLDQTEAFAEVHGWFATIEKGYPRSAWGNHSFHANAILWESFAHISSIVRPGSSFAEDLKDFLDDLEHYLKLEFDKDPNAWSFSGARAAVLSWRAAERPSRRRHFEGVIDAYMSRWMEISKSMKSSEAYTCGPLQGAAPLLLRRGDQAAELVGPLLELAQQDVVLFQVQGVRGPVESRSFAAQRLGDEMLSKHSEGLEGAFLRDEAQLLQESRMSIRIDDTSQCIMALHRTLELLDDLEGFDSSEQGGSQEQQTTTITTTPKLVKRSDLAGGAFAKREF